MTDIARESRKLTDEKTKLLRAAVERRKEQPVTPNKRSDLLPCPHCGAKHGAKTGGPKLMVSDSGHGWTVRCSHCLARGPNCFVKADAIAAWQSRTPIGSDLVERTVRDLA